MLFTTDVLNNKLVMLTLHCGVLTLYFCLRKLRCFFSNSGLLVGFFVCFFTECPEPCFGLLCAIAMQIIAINFHCFCYTVKVLALKPTCTLFNCLISI